MKYLDDDLWDDLIDVQDAEPVCWACRKVAWTNYDGVCEECLSKVSDFMRSF